MEKRQKPTLHNDWIDKSAIDIVRRLQNAGHSTYLVGGCVRDLLVGLHPKDYDIATKASPSEIRRIIKGSYIIGRRFQLVLVKRGNQQFEVATFRRNALPEEKNDNESKHPVSADNYFGTPEEDAKRRDFTINALFYDPITKELIDFVDGSKDIDSGQIRMIGDPSTRIKEDPIRILRAVRFAHKLKFSIESELRKSIQEHSNLICNSVLPRKREEYLKLLRLNDPSLAFLELYDLNVLQNTLPTLAAVLNNNQQNEQVLLYLKRAHEIIDDPSSPIQAILPIYMAVASLTQNPEELLNLETFFKEEMGTFRGEHSLIQFSYQLQEALLGIDRFAKKGLRRQKSFIDQEEFPLALLMAEKDFNIAGPSILFWEQKSKELQKFTDN
jgi:poly(A) polymerase